MLTRSRPADEIAAALDPGDLHLGDAADPAAIERALEGCDRVVYSAGGLLPAASEEDPERDAELTLAPLRSVLEALRSRPDAALVYISSGGTVYGDPERLPVDESAPTDPRGSYGRLHLECEREIERHREQTGLSTRILRCSTVYGEHQRPDRGQGAIVTFLHRIERGDEIELYGAEETVRDYVYAGDVARVVADLLPREDGPRVLNVAAGVGTSLRDLVGLAEELVGREANVREHPPRDFDVREIVLDVGRLRELTGFEPTPLRAGMERAHRWLGTIETERV